MTPKEEVIKDLENMAEKLFSDPIISKYYPPVFAGALATLKARASGVGSEELFDRAITGDSDADWSLCYQATELLSANEPLPPPLALYVLGILQERLLERNQGKGDPYKNTKRDEFIVQAVRRLQEVGFNPTRNKSSHESDAPDSTCSVVKKLLAKHRMHIVESTVETVWTDSVRN